MKITECPRDAMQGLHEFIPTKDKIRYINALLKVGFDVIDFGSFVSPKAIPQMRDTAEVMANLELETSKSKLLAIVANLRGAEDALQHQQIDFLGFPLSISETFQQRNTNKSIDEAIAVVEQIQNKTDQAGKQLVVYLSMGFGNPYGEEYNPNIVSEFVAKLNTMGVGIVSLADTIGSATPDLITAVFKQVISDFPELTISAHFHSTPQKAMEKIEAAWNAGCKSIEGAIGGMGGCPMAKDDLTGNIATENILAFCQKKSIATTIDLAEFKKASIIKSELFG
ncbi:hydroxymethylglutaryl-CoA lyase [Chondrinema litorale]|uniref:hydroxymethylglutaryl-CoA lyase n=1 Tax=Chondrinema litorale TaxID=2994555 RepID=UPI0025436A4C|nr:hydroxymethylglutaryl-CoA lyase [Chondrinema litorale]UZR94114.1 hydroxymethylglutaryl-CoA lyase [Chondrinema litorale]